MRHKEAIQAYPAMAGRFFAYAIKRFWGDRGPQVAAALSYSSLLALVPVLAIGVGLLSAFPADVKAAAP